MSVSAKSFEDDSLNDSWVDLNASVESGLGETRRATPIASIFNSGKLEKLLWEAQRESNQSSCVGSGVSSYWGSPKTPTSPVSLHSPLAEENLQPYLADTASILNRKKGNTDWIWDWSSRPDQNPPKEWKLLHVKQVPKPRLSFRKSKVVKSGLFSTEMLSVLIITNVISIVLGTGIGIYIGKRVGYSTLNFPKY